MMEKIVQIMILNIIMIHIMMENIHLQCVKRHVYNVIYGTAAVVLVCIVTIFKCMFSNQFHRHFWVNKSY